MCNVYEKSKDRNIYLTKKVKHVFRKCSTCTKNGLDVYKKIYNMHFKSRHLLNIVKRKEKENKERKTKENRKGEHKKRGKQLKTNEICKEKSGKREKK